MCLYFTFRGIEHFLIARFEKEKILKESNKIQSFNFKVKLALVRMEMIKNLNAIIL